MSHPALVRQLARLCVLAGLSFVSLHQEANAQVGSADSSRIVEYRGGHWFDGTKFKSEPRWIRGGQFISKPARNADSHV